MALQCFEAFVPRWMEDSLELERRVEAHFSDAAFCHAGARDHAAELTRITDSLLEMNAHEWLVEIVRTQNRMFFLRAIFTASTSGWPTSSCGSGGPTGEMSRGGPAPQRTSRRWHDA